VKLLKVHCLHPSRHVHNGAFLIVCLCAVYIYIYIYIYIYHQSYLHVCIFTGNDTGVWMTDRKCVLMCLVKLAIIREISDNL